LALNDVEAISVPAGTSEVAFLRCAYSKIVGGNGLTSPVTIDHLKFIATRVDFIASSVVP
jgi:hypothetical protein